MNRTYMPVKKNDYTPITGILMPTSAVPRPYTQYEQSLKPMYRAIECATVERLPLGKGIVLWLDEEGAFTRKHNTPLTVLAQSFTNAGHQIYGTGVILGEDEDGNMVSLTAEQLEELDRVIDID